MPSFRVIKINGKEKVFGKFTVKDNKEESIKRVASRVVHVLIHKKYIKDESKGTIILQEITHGKKDCYKVIFIGKSIKVEKIADSHCNTLNKSGGNKAKRYFTIVDFPQEGRSHGSYSGSTPRRAASKAFTQLAKLYNFKNSTNDYKYISFTIRETTRNSANKEYTFYGTRVKLFKPTIVNHNGKTIKYYYKNIITNSKDV